MDNGFSLHAVNLKVILLLKAFNRINNSMYVVIKATLRLNFKVILLLKAFNRINKIKRDFEIFNLNHCFYYNIHAVILIVVC
jgi:hypothetical protein